MELNIVDNKKKLPVNEKVFESAYNESLVHQVVTSYLAQARSGTKAQKNRSAVSGGGIKPWKQKGTGRARAGTIRSPLWRKGGVTFAAQPRSFDKKVNKKMYRAALKSIFSELIRQDRLVVVENLKVEEAKTKSFKSEMDKLGVNCRNLLLVSEMIDESVYLAARNLPSVGTIDVSEVDPVSLVGSDTVVITVAALQQIEGSLA